MDLIYSMRRKPLKCEPPHFDSTQDPEVTRPICTISTCNIIAFSSVTDLADCDGDSWGGYVYVCDLDTPWDSHKVTSTVYPISALEWDSEGKHLLVATTVGDVSVYGQKEYLLNEWTLLYSANFPGEQIIKASFFHNGRRVIALEKKPDAPITERVHVLRAAPTLRAFGGAAAEGACIITGTGLIGIITPGEGDQVQTATDCLRATRDHIVSASIAHKGGKMLVGAAWRRGARRGVRCAAVSVPRAGSVRLQPLPSLHLPDDAHALPVCITWWLRDDGDSLLVAGTTLTLWKLTERAYPVHKLLAKGPVQGSTTPGGGQKTSDCFNTISWQQTCTWALEGDGTGGAGAGAVGGAATGATSVSAARLALGTAHAVVTTPRALQLLARDTHHYLCSRPVVTSGSPGVIPEAAPGAGTPPKKPKYGAGALPVGAAGASVWCAEMSALGGVVVAVDSHSQLHVYRLHQPAADIPTPLAVQHLASLLEYSMVSGYDCLDILMTLKPNVIEAVYERLTENFQRQSQPFQQYYYHSWIKLRSALCGLSACGQNGAAALAALQMCAAAWAACAAGARPEPDTPAPLAALLDEPPPHTLDDKNLVALESKVELLSDNSVVQVLQPLQALRRPLQRAVHTALSALASLHASAGHHPHGSYELWSDPTAVNLLRKLVLVARSYGRGGGEALSRPLARLACTTTPKPELLEECAMACAAPGRVWDALPRCAVAAPHGRAHPLYLEYSVEPESLRYVPEPPAYAQSDVTPSVDMDAVRYMYLGGGRVPARWRQCGRCGARALAAAQPARHPLQRAHDGRFMAACRCGGKWTLVNNV